MRWKAPKIPLSHLQAEVALASKLLNNRGANQFE
jgi:hypothetical protein